MKYFSLLYSVESRVKYFFNILLSAAVRELSRLEYSGSEDKTDIVLFFGCASEQYTIIDILRA